MDIVDVWFESGASWHAVLEAEPELHWPADLYTEGGDQHRGWFHSSLLTSVAIRGAAPYKTVATSGWTLDEQGRAFSKSLGNGVDPVDVAKRLGGEIVRLWVASVDFREDVAASETLMQRVADNYRKLRNTFRFLLGNLHGFEPREHAVGWPQMQPIDQYMLVRTKDLTEKVTKWYEQFEFHRVYQAVIEFCVVDLSSLYLDVLKDRMYTFAPTDPARRSAQTVLWTITEALVRLVAPILSFTAEEVWGYLPGTGEREASVHLAHFLKPEVLVAEDTTELSREWAELLVMRDVALKSLETARKDGRIGKALEAKILLTLSAEPFALAQKYQSCLKELFNVSQVELARTTKAEDVTGVTAETLPADGVKCERCWNYSLHVGEDKRWPTVCDRCAIALDAMGFPAINDEAGVA
jgi:isoleucyl-tRNA synthetase